MRILLSFLPALFATGVGLAGSGAFSTPFELQSGFVIIHAEVDGIEGAYILDSGAPGLILNKERHTYASRETVGLVGTGGTTDGEIVEVSTFRWSLFSTEKIAAISLDLSYLETRLGRPLSGLVGMDMFRGYGIMVDYEASTVTLTRENVEALLPEPYVRIPLSMEGHLPVVTCDAGGRTLRFGIDTGARSNMLCKSAYAQLLPEHTTVIRTIEVVGVDQKAVPAQEVDVSELRVNGNLLAPMTFVVSDLGPLAKESTVRIDGIIGQPFFGKRKVFFDAKRTHIYVTAEATDMTAPPLAAGL